MLRKVLCLMALGMVLLAGGCTSDDDAVNVSGLWKMSTTSFAIFTFDLSLNQSGESLTGFMDSTNTGDPTDSISGIVSPGGTITFTRTRAGAWTQVYTGTVKSSTLMEGTFTHTPGPDGPWTWSAVR